LSERDAQVAGARAGAGLFRLPERGVIEVTGSERVRWLDGMLTQDVKALAAAGPGAGGYALLLTQQGRIVADLHLLVDADGIWLEGERAHLPGVIARLEKLIIADDVALADRSEAVARLAVEGPRAGEALAAALGEAPALAPGAWAARAIGDVPLRMAAFALGEGPGFQLFAPAERGEAVARALLACGLTAAGADALELLRIEAGRPRLGCELDESVLPAEARLLDAAVSVTKGCYTGQEVVARLRSRGRMNHLLVGLCFEGRGAAWLPGKGTALTHAGRRAGEVTSAVLSPRFGPIGLGYVRHEWSVPGTLLELEDGRARVVALPFAAEGSEASTSP
jgi:folate-binding protein YgfZ